MVKAKFKEIKIEDLKKFFSKVGVNMDIPSEGVARFAIVEDKNDSEYVKAVVFVGGEKMEVPIPIENYVSYLKFGRFDVKPKRVRKSGGNGGRKRGEKTEFILSEVKKFVLEKGEVRLGDLWKELNSRGIVKYRPQLFQIVKRYCDIEYTQSAGGRKEILVKGVNL